MLEASIEGELMVTVCLSKEIETRLDHLAEITGLTKTALAREAIVEHIDDLEDYFLADARARKNNKAVSLDEVARQLHLAG